MMGGYSWRSTPQDPRRLTMLPHEIARQPVGERQRIHGPLQPMVEPRRRSGALDRFALRLAGATLAWFVLSLIFRSA